MRKTTHNIGEFFKGRFSPRAFKNHDISSSDIEAILEAATTAPSAYNEQPWRFVLADKSKFHAVLADGNMEWCKDVENFVLVCADTKFRRNGKPNDYAWFDAGAAWGFMAMEALNRGIYLHAMSGFYADKAVEVFELGDLVALVVVAMGKDPEITEFTPRDPLETKIIKK